MSPHRVADAARISPYPTNIRVQEQEPPDASTAQGSGQGSSSPSKARLASSRQPRPERSTPRQDEDPRFNIGPRNIRNLMSRRSGRTGRPGRSTLEGIDEVVPDYPPPSFQEAIGSPVLSSNAAGPSSLQGSLDIPRFPDEHHHHDASESEYSFSVPGSRDSPSDTPSASESEDSLEIVETTRPFRPAERGQDEWRGHRGIEFPSPGPSLGSPTCVNASIPPSSEGLLRGRAKTKLRSVLDFSEEVLTPEPDASAVRSTKKRFLSLSPLRTLFPPRHQALEAQRALSAHPSPGNLPYSTSRPAHFFRSTTSLATSSVLRLPFASSTLTLTANKPESIKSRLFHSKEKEPLDESHRRPPESLESWEILGEEECHPRSLMSLVVPASNSPMPVASPVSPARSISFSFRTPKLQPSPAPPPTPPTPQPATLSPPPAPAQSLNEPHPLSLRDRKVAEAIEPFLRKRGRKAGAQRSRTTPNPVITVAPSPGPPAVITVRTRMSPAGQSTPQPTATATAVTAGATAVAAIATPKATPAPEAGPFKNAGASSSDGERPDLQRALDTPLPSSPMQTPMRMCSSPSSLTISVSSPTTPVAAQGRMVLSESEMIVQPSASMPTPKLSAELDTPVPRSKAIECACLHQPSTAVAHKIGTQNSNASSSSLHLEALMTSPSSPQGRRHYLGRPLPRPPQPRNVVVDSIYAGDDVVFSSHGSSQGSYCPEGLLIDLENDASQNAHVPSPPADDYENRGLYATTSTSTSTTPTTPNHQSRSSPIGPMMMTGDDGSVRSLPLSFSSADVSSLSGLSEMTDLDLLAAALSEDGSSSGDYETMMLISDFLGPADAARASRAGVVAGSSADTADERNVSLTGRVEVQRRRVTADGRVKLKLSVFGVGVNRCGICLSQFREGESASMSLACRHVFHHRCLAQWLVRSHTCPLCRIFVYNT